MHLHEHGGLPLLAAVFSYSHRHLELLLLLPPASQHHRLPPACIGRGGRPRGRPLLPPYTDGRRWVSRPGAMHWGYGAGDAPRKPWCLPTASPLAPIRAVCLSSSLFGPRSLGPRTPQWPVQRFWRELVRFAKRKPCSLGRTLKNWVLPVSSPGSLHEVPRGTRNGALCVSEGPAHCAQFRAVWGRSPGPDQGRAVMAAIPPPAPDCSRRRAAAGCGWLARRQNGPSIVARGSASAATGGCRGLRAVRTDQFLPALTRCSLRVVSCLQFGSDRTSELYMTDLHPRLWSRVVTGHQLFGTRWVFAVTCRRCLSFVAAPEWATAGPLRRAAGFQILTTRGGCRFSESLNTVKDVAEESISKDYNSLISDTEKSVKKDMSHEFSSYGHTMWDLNK
jgi:hypothetical protein